MLCVRSSGIHKRASDAGNPVNMIKRLSYF
jgi:hypothetical protein